MPTRHLGQRRPMGGAASSVSAHVWHTQRCAHGISSSRSSRGTSVRQTQHSRMGMAGGGCAGGGGAAVAASAKNSSGSGSGIGMGMGTGMADGCGSGGSGGGGGGGGALAA